MAPLQSSNASHLLDFLPSSRVCIAYIFIPISFLFLYLIVLVSTKSRANIMTAFRARLETFYSDVKLKYFFSDIKAKSLPVASTGDIKASIAQHPGPVTAHRQDDVKQHAVVVPKPTKRVATVAATVTGTLEVQLSNNSSSSDVYAFISMDLLDHLFLPLRTADGCCSWDCDSLQQFTLPFEV